MDRREQEQTKSSMQGNAETMANKASEAKVSLLFDAHYIRLTLYELIEYHG